MRAIYIESAQQTNGLRELVQSAIEGEIVRLELALSLAKKRLLPFEQKYDVTSEYFISEMAAEDLAGGMMSM